MRCWSRSIISFNSINRLCAGNERGRSQRKTVERKNKAKRINWLGARIHEIFPFRWQRRRKASHNIDRQLKRPFIKTLRRRSHPSYNFQFPSLERWNQNDTKCSKAFKKLCSLALSINDLRKQLSKVGTVNTLWNLVLEILRFKDFEWC